MNQYAVRLSGSNNDNVYSYIMIHVTVTRICIDFLHDVVFVHYTYTYPSDIN